jgi:hypothetical protein
MAHTAFSDEAEKYGRKHFMIRARLTKGLRTGKMSIRTFLDDDRVKMTYPQACCYCGAEGGLTLDHLLPKVRGGPESADNTVWSCKSCNSSKGKKDVLVWLAQTDRFPPILLLRRYLKLAIRHCIDNGLLDVEIEDAPPLPFDLSAIPTKYPNPRDLVLWITPIAE